MTTTWARRLHIAAWFAASLTAFAPRAALPATASTVSPPPSFNCAKPSEVEAEICRDPVLSAADKRLAFFYDIAKAGAIGRGSNQLARQREWLRGRDKACAKGAWKNSTRNAHDCLVDEYDERLEQLAVATLLVMPNESLAELRRIRPRAEPLYKAALDYASIDDPKRRIEVVEADLAPIFSTMDANTREHLTLPPYYNAATARDAASSDANFAAFFSIYATLANDDNNSMTWPCAVLIKRPGLIVGLGSYFGGAIDGRIPSSDCDAVLPPTSEFAALSAAAYGAQPACEGTIRFSTGRDYVKLEDAVRLHRTEVWETKDPPDAESDKEPPDPAVSAWRRSHETEVGKAEAALESYYIKDFGVEPKQARRDAWSAIDELIEEPFESCE